MSLKCFRGDLAVRAVRDIDFSKEWDSGIRGIIFDIDNTLVPHGAPADDASVRLFSGLRAMGFSVCIISNNHAPRVVPFAEKVGCRYVFDAGKPKKGSYVKAMAELGTGETDTLFIGDQIFTDVFGANRAGIRTILVNPIDEKTDPPFVRFKRFIERTVLRRKYA